MTNNMGRTDKLIRLAFAAIVAILYFTGTISGTLAIILGVLAIVFALTSLVGYCPLYSVFGMNTNKK